MSKQIEDIIVDGTAEGCCGGPAPEDTNACCVADADAKAAGDDGCGCGCGTSSADFEKKSASSCC